MPTLSEETVAAIGRMTVAAADLEHLLAEIAGDREAVSRPGGALAAARASAQDAPADVRAAFAPAVEAAATQLAIVHNTLRRLWGTPEPAGPAVFDEVAVHVWRCREWLRLVAGEYVDGPPPPSRATDVDVCINVDVNTSVNMLMPH